MTTVPTDLASYVDGAASSDAEFLLACEARAQALLSAYLGSAVVPPEVVRAAELEVAAELFARRGLSHGLVTFGGGEGDVQAVRVNRDPLTLAYPLLARYVRPGIA